LEKEFVDEGIKNDFSGKTGWMISLTGFYIE
jgi:hypothetical protein